MSLLLLLSFSSGPLSHNSFFLWFRVIFWACIWDIYLWDSWVFCARDTVLRGWRDFLLHGPCFVVGIPGSDAHLAADPKNRMFSLCPRQYWYWYLSLGETHFFFFLICHSLFLAQVIAHFFLIYLHFKSNLWV